MNERSLFKGIGDAIRGRKSTNSRLHPLTTVEHRCPECQNALDPSWTRCPYCEAKKKAGDKTSRPPTDSAAPSPARRSTRADTPVSAAADVPAATPAPAPSSRSHTMVDSQPVGSGAARSGGGDRRLTGVVTSFTWSRLGQLFKVLDGRNYVGSGDVSTENNRICDIQVTDDHLMSGAHFLILCQGGKYIISDNLSTNGTFLNGEQIDTRGVELPDHAVIKAGATVFGFQKIQPPQIGATAGNKDRLTPANNDRLTAGDNDGGEHHPSPPTSGGREDTVI